MDEELMNRRFKSGFLSGRLKSNIECCPGSQPEYMLGHAQAVIGGLVLFNIARRPFAQISFSRGITPFAMN